MTQSLANTPPILYSDIGETKLGDFGFGHRYPRPGSDRWATAIIIRGNIAIGVVGGEASKGALYVDPLKLARRIDKYFVTSPKPLSTENRKPVEMKIDVLRPAEPNKEPSKVRVSQKEVITYLVNEPYRVHLDFPQPKDTLIEVRLYVDNAEIWEDASRQIWVTPRATPTLRIQTYALDEAGACIANGEHQIAIALKNNDIPKTQR